MADSDRIQLILDLGASGLNAAEVRRELEKLNAAAKDVGATYEVLAVSGQGYELGEERLTIAHKRQTEAMEAAAAEAKRLAAEEQRLADEGIDKVTRAAIEATQAQKAMNIVLDTTHGGIGTVTGSTKNFGSALLQTSYAVQDFTSQIGTRGLAGGLAAVQNNIPGILAGLGTSGGIAAVASLAAVSVGLLYENWGKLREALGADDIGKRIEDMKALAKATEDVNAANEKIAKSVKGKDQTDAGAAFRKALEAYGGGEKLLNESSADKRPVIADAIAKALQGSESDIGFLKGGSQGLARELNRPALQKEAAERDAEYERRAKEREKAQKEQEQADKAAEAAKQKADDAAAKVKDKLLDGLDKVIATGDKALAPDERGDRRRADIQQRAGFGLDFKDFAKAQGYNPLKGDVADAARSIQDDVNGGVSEDEALQNALQKLLSTVQKNIEVSNKRAMTARQFQAGVDNLPVLLDEGN